MRHYLSRLLLAVSLLASVSHAADEIPEEWDVILEVNQRDSTAKDDDPTTPFRTIKAAADNALQFARAGRTVRVLIHPGTYREDIGLKGKEGEETAMIQFKGTKPGSVILNGSDLAKGWDINRKNHFELEYARASERPMVFVEGARLLEVKSLGEMKLGTVYFGENKITILPPKGGVIVDGSVEISRNRIGFNAKHVDSLFFESLAFERGYRSALWANTGTTLILNNVSVEYCTETGIVANGFQHARLRRFIVERCGWSGLALQGMDKVTITGSEANLNGWDSAANASKNSDGTPGALLDACGEVKVWSLRIAENHDGGIIVRKGTGKTAMGKMAVVKNKSFGLFCLEMQAKTTISESEFVYNEGPGARVDQSAFLIGNMFYGNDGAQIEFINGGRISRNIIVAQRREKLISLLGDDAAIESGSNLFEAPAKKPFGMSGQALTFAEWQETTKADLNSYFGDAMLLDPKNYSFTPKPGSPWFEMKSWPVRELN